jgi:hypothetical protein
MPKRLVMRMIEDDRCGDIRHCKCEDYDDIKCIKDAMTMAAATTANDLGDDGTGGSPFLSLSPMVTIMTMAKICKAE